ncbi:MAG TPA: GGDEF domain-containing protein [Sphingobium sp.]|nr:GGDEF domain-containing protein [Sphingobium sp.]
MGENFAFFLPIMMASFAIAFLMVWSWRVPAAGWWSAAFACISAAFTTPVGLAAFPTPLWGLAADLFLATGFLLFSQALLERWRPSWLLSVRLAIWASSLLLCGLGLWFDALPLSLVASDLGCFLLIALPLIAARGHLRSGGDRALFVAASLIALDTVVRGSTVPLTLAGNSDFMGSDYAFFMQALACVLGLFLALAALATQVTDLLVRYRRDAMVDPLSGLLNRRGFDDGVATTGRQGSLIVCDIDHFKAVNDALGHATGDQVIAVLADRLREAAPSHALAARFGGEEFVLFLPEADAARAAEIADQVRAAFTRAVALRLDLARPVTASFGLSTTQRSDSSIHDAIARADAALYEAKARGRNRLCVRRALSSPDTGVRPLPPRAASA